MIYINSAQLAFIQILNDTLIFVPGCFTEDLLGYN